jgi:PAS domain S-box-containing protein
VTSKALRLLLVEDSEDDAHLLVREMERAGYEIQWGRVDTVAGMRGALEREKWDVVVADYNMPHFSAPEALDLLKRVDLDLPFIVISGSIGDEVGVETMKAGAHDYLVKGNLRRLIPVVERELEQADQRRARRAAEEQYRLLFESNPQPMWVVDRETLRFLAVNEAAIAHYGYSREEFLGMTIAEIRPAGDVPALLAAMPGVAEGLHEKEVWRHRKKGGELIQVEVTTHGLTFAGRHAFFALATDVTDRLRAEEALRASEERYRGLMEHAQDAIFVADKWGTVVEANAAAERLLKRPRSAIEGRSFVEAIAEEHREDVQRRFERTLERGSTQGEETRALRSDGTAVPIEISASVVEVGSEKLVLAIIRDISEQNAMAEQFRLSQKMEAVGLLAGGVAHDFNNLLTAILGYSQLLARELRGNPEQFSAIEEIRKAGERAASLTRQLLAFSRKQVLALTILDLNAVVRHIEEMLSRLIGEDIEITTRFDRELGSVRADAGQIEQVIMNLAVNARDAMPKGGRILIETANVELEEGYIQTHVHAEPGPYVLLAVSDTGLGMDEATRSRIFEPFFTTKEKGRGTGLGLSTVYGIVKQSGGYIWVYSEPGKGTTFKVYLPRVATAAEPLPVSKDQEIARGGTETILLVEDEDAVRALASRILESKGYTVLLAESGAQAIEIARENPAIDLLLTDMVLPGMGGSEISKRIHELAPRTKVLYTSGYTDDVIVRRGLMERDAAFLEKPFTPNVLARRVREVLDR